MLTQELVRRLFDYHEDGYLTWKTPPYKHSQISGIAGTKRSDGRYQVSIGGKR